MCIRDRQDIFPIIHTLKGEAGLLELAIFEEKSHDFEDVIGELRARAEVTGDDLLSLMVKLDKLMSDVQAVREMVERITSLRETFTVPEPVSIAKVGASAKNTETGALATLDEFRRLAQKLAADQGKQVTLCLLYTSRCV